MFNVPLPDRSTEGDLASPLFRPRSEADTRFRHETNHDLKNTLPPDLSAALEGLRRAIEGRDSAG
jgi:hypothetical protein